MSKEKLISNNRKAFHDYHILETYTTGMVLTGTEIKSIRAGKVNLKDSFAKIEGNEVYVHNMHISPYEMGNIYNHDPERKRKLLLNSQEIKKLIGKIKQSGLTLVPTKLFLLNGWAKLEIGLAQGKKLHDKREALAQKDTKREIDRALKSRY